MASQDDNFSQVLYGVSHLDGTTPTAIKFNPNGSANLDFNTSIAFDPTVNVSRTQNAKTLAMATSSADNITIRPWVVNATTGAILATNT